MEEKLKRIEEKIKKLSIQLEILQKQKKEIVEGQQIAIWQERRKNGWKPFIYYSSYYGSECGVSDTKLLYVFSPAAAEFIDLEKWKNVEFSHGDSTESETNKEFEKELEKLDYDCYDYVEDHIIQAVWPELYEIYKRM
jgi:hypothetical protein